MKKSIVVALVLGLVAGALAAPATAKKKKPKPQQVTLYLHGNDDVGELEYVNAGDFQKMDTEEPSGSQAKSRFATNYILGPNTECSGNALLPTWRGTLSGNVVGDLKVTLHTVSTPAAQLSVELYADGDGGCNSAALGVEEYTPAVAEQVVDVAPGPAVTEVVFEKVKFKTIATLVLMVHIQPVAQNRSPHQVRLLYDGAAQASMVELTCVPPKGSTTCT